MAEIKIDTKSPNAGRGTAGMFGAAMIFFGAFVQWGPGAAFLSIGLIIVISCAIDEIAERITKILAQTGKSGA